MKNVDNAISKIKSKGTPNFSKTAPIIEWQGKDTGELVTLEVEKIDESCVNSDEYTSELTTEDSLMHLFKSYYYDSTAGYYYLNDKVSIDPTTIDFSENQKYYYMWEGYGVGTDNKIVNSITGFGTTLYEVVGANKEKGQISLGSPARNYSTNKYILKLKKMISQIKESDKSDKGLYEANDDYGTSYYYRGNISNNNVYFAGYYWQITRINGDGSVRLLLKGKNATDYMSISNILFYNQKLNSPIDLEYMHGSDLSTSENALKNEVDSGVKASLDNWYKNNIVGKNLSEYIADNGFCNDRSLSSGDGFSIDKETIYSDYTRLNNSTPTLNCPNIERDLFTTSLSNIGNKALTYPIGLLTSDELIMSGYDHSSNNPLVFTNFNHQNYYTMTPALYSNYSIIIINYGVDYLTPSSLIFNSNVRPVINLKADVEITGGIGTVNDPFVVKTT